jgi:hypothetical protein
VRFKRSQSLKPVKLKNRPRRVVRGFVRRATTAKHQRQLAIIQLAYLSGGNLEERGFKTRCPLLRLVREAKQQEMLAAA